jgi:hypothetical protein
LRVILGLFRSLPVKPKKAPEQALYLSGALEAASWIEPLYRALQAQYAAANSLVRGHFSGRWDRFGNNLGADFRSRAICKGQLRLVTHSPLLSSG